VTSAFPTRRVAGWGCRILATVDEWRQLAGVACAIAVAVLALGMWLAGDPASAIVPVQVGAWWMLNEIFHPLSRLTKFVVCFRHDQRHAPPLHTR
jgi:sterol desaturase/sphingolipid hydroxylase (fatty acid hydroxylase superfamily)